MLVLTDTLRKTIEAAIEEILPGIVFLRTREKEEVYGDFLESSFQG